ncbi:MAG: prepilin-type N-terminal cleavage/methylation domain-containing protein [Proteobacteria bacterium]|nr:prepilin-type N-terminal cleavage/methylation domain-containing protein [Pseudomonadota bacterium]MBU4054829.1 prepilin-type N-terminal cleavage/methylation domain-containing protein [Pseudomonadota bacterium]
MKYFSKKGFTLVELMTSLSIVSVMMAVSLPGILSWIPEKQLRSASRELHDNIQYARIYAIKAGQDCYLDFNEPNTGQYTLSLNSKTLKIADLSKYNDHLQFDDPPERITFRSNGITRSNEKTEVKVTGGGKSYRTTVFVSGAIKLEEL